MLYKLKFWKEVQYVSFLGLVLFLFSACETDNLTLEPTLVAPLVNGEVGLDVNEEADVIEPASFTLGIQGLSTGAVPSNLDPNGPVPALETPEQTYNYSDLDFSEVSFTSLTVSISISNNTGIDLAPGIQLSVKNADGSAFTNIVTDKTIRTGTTETFSDSGVKTLKNSISLKASNIRTPGGNFNGSSLGVTIDFPTLEVNYLDINPGFTGEFIETTDFNFDLGNDEDIQEVTGEVDVILTNELPLDFTANLVFLGAGGSPIFSLDPITVSAGSPTSPQTSSSAKITGTQVDQLRNAKQVEARITYTTPAGETARLESGAKVKYNLSGKVTPSIKLD